MHHSSWHCVSKINIKSQILVILFILVIFSIVRPNCWDIPLCLCGKNKKNSVLPQFANLIVMMQQCKISLNPDPFLFVIHNLHTPKGEMIPFGVFEIYNTYIFLLILTIEKICEEAKCFLCKYAAHQAPQ